MISSILATGILLNLGTMLVRQPSNTAFTATIHQSLSYHYDSRLETTNPRLNALLQVDRKKTSKSIPGHANGPSHALVKKTLMKDPLIGITYRVKIRSPFSNVNSTYNLQKINLRKSVNHVLSGHIPTNGLDLHWSNVLLYKGVRFALNVQLMPKSIRSNPKFKKILVKIPENPLANRNISDTRNNGVGTHLADGHTAYWTFYRLVSNNGVVLWAENSKWEMSVNAVGKLFASVQAYRDLRRLMLSIRPTQADLPLMENIFNKELLYEKEHKAKLKQPQSAEKSHKPVI